jgi:hypothetical protein
MQQKILQGCGLGIFPTNTDGGAPGALGGLLTLITKHGTHNISGDA